jgi:hypothetical protein
MVQQNVQLCRERGYWVIEPGMGVEANTPCNKRSHREASSVQLHRDARDL